MGIGGVVGALGLEGRASGDAPTGGVSFMFEGDMEDDLVAALRTSPRGRHRAKTDQVRTVRQKYATRLRRHV